MQNGRIKRTLVQSFFRMHLGMLIRHWFSALHIFTAGSSQILNFSEVLRLENAVNSFQSWVQFQNHSMIFSKERWGPTIVRSIASMIFRALLSSFSSNCSEN